MSQSVCVHPRHLFQMGQVPVVQEEGRSISLSDQDRRPQTCRQLLYPPNLSLKSSVSTVLVYCMCFHGLKSQWYCTVVEEVPYRKGDIRVEDCQEFYIIRISLSHIYICFADIGTRGDEISGNTDTSTETEADAAAIDSETVSISDVSSSRQDLSNIDNTLKVQKNISGEFCVQYAYKV